MKNKIIDEEIIEIATKSQTMALAARRCGMGYKSFIRHAKRLGVYKPNQAGKGVKEDYKRKNTINLNEILAGKYPQYSTYKLKIRLIKEGIKEDKCEKCGWNEKLENYEFTPCELHHIDGNSKNHLLSNLIILCPNCHSLTKSYRFRRGKVNEQQGRKLLIESER